MEKDWLRERVFLCWMESLREEIEVWREWREERVLER